jgi:hypothetical protein
MAFSANKDTREDCGQAGCDGVRPQTVNHNRFWRRRQKQVDRGAGVPVWNLELLV